MAAFNNFKKWARSNADSALELIRIYLGIGLLIKGIHFVLHADFLINVLQNAGHLSFANTLITHLVGLTHIGGGILLAVGLITRISALMQIPILTGALVLVSAQKGLFTQGQSFEFTALVLFLLIIFAVIGGGKWSVDQRVLNQE